MIKKYAYLPAAGFMLLCFSFFQGCTYLPNPIYPRHDLGESIDTVYNITIYDFDELYAMFHTDDYSALESLYVAPSGSDESGLGSSASPFATIGRALEAAGAGTIIRVREGLYNEANTITAGGAAGAPLVIYSEDGRGKARVDGGGEHSVFSTTENHVIIDGLELFNASSFGVGVYSGEDLTGTLPADEAGGRFCIVRNCIIHDIYEEGIKGAQNRFYLIENNEIYDITGEQAIDCVTSFHVIIRNNDIHDCPFGAGYCKGGSANVFWEGNRITGSAGQHFGIILGGQSSLYVTLRDENPADIPEAYEQWAFNNVFVDCPRMAILFESAEKCRVYNNTFYNCNYQSNELFSVANDAGINFKRTSNISIMNNIIKNDSDKPLRYFIGDSNSYSDLGLVTGYNSVDSGGGDFLWSYNGYQPESGDETASVSFTAPSSDDYSLAAGSSGIDSGTDLSASISTDITGTARPQGPAMDRGAYEQ